MTTTTTLEWLRLLYPGEPTGHLVIWSGRDHRSRWFSAVNLEGAAAQAAGLAVRHDVYAGVGLHPRQLGEGERGRADGVCALPGLWLDLDVAGAAHQGDDLPPDRKAARRILAEFALPPTAIVDSGHGLQAWWLFPELWRFSSPAEHAAAAELSRRFQATLCGIGKGLGWHVDSTPDLSRVLRVPGTWNRKLDPVPVEVVEVDPDRRYRPEDFEPHLVAVEVVREPAPPVEGDIVAHHRNTTLTSLAGTMRRRGMTEEAIAAALLAENEGRCSPPLPEAEVRGIAKSVAKKAPAGGDDHQGDGDHHGDVDDEDRTRSRPSMATELVAIAGDRYRLGVSTAGEAFAVPLSEPLIVRSLRGGRGSLRAELAAVYAESKGRVPSSSALTDALAVLEGQAQQAEPEHLGLRVATHGQGVVIDLGDADGRAVVVEPGAWRVVPRSPVLFRRSELTGTLPAPIPGGSLDDDLRPLLNITDDAWPVVVTFLVSSMLPDLPHPVALFTGEHGTGKTTAMGKVARTVDPSPAQVRSAPRDLDQWSLAASGSWVVPLDNISTPPLPPSIPRSWALCLIWWPRS